MKYTSLLLLLITAPTYGAALAPTRADCPAHPVVVEKIDRVIVAGLGPSLPSLPELAWIEPIIVELDFVSGSKRFWLGIVHGSSHVRMRVRVHEGDKVTVQEFYRAAGAWKGTFTVGHTDNKMLELVAQDIVDYVGRFKWEQDASNSTKQNAKPIQNVREEATGASNASDLYDLLIKLEDLRERGLLSQEEFEAEKKKLLTGR